MPLPLVRRLPASRRRAHFRLAVRNRQWGRLTGILGKQDPYPHTALFAGVDVLLSEGRDAEIPNLAPLQEGNNAFVRAMFKALCKHAEGRTDAAIEQFDRYGSGDRFDGYRRMCARAWSLFLKLPRLPEVSPLPAKPPEIVQFWDKKNVPSDVMRGVQGWRDGSGLSHRLFDAEQAREFLGAHFSPEAVQIFDRCPHPAIQSDYFRLGWLALNGGLYIDADEAVVPEFKKIAPLLAGRLVLRFCTNQPDGHFLNGFIAAPQGSPVMSAAFEEATRRLSKDMESHVYALSGPGMLTDVVLAELSKGPFDQLALLTHSTTKRLVAKGINARYKADGRSWHTWQAERNQGAA